MSLIAIALTTAISSLIRKSGNRTQSNDEQLQQQILLEQEKQREEDQKRRQNTLIIISISIFLVLGAIIAFTAIQKGNQKKIVKT